MDAFEYLEKEWAEFNGLKPENMVGCSSGTAALHLALECLGLHSNVLVPDFTMIACPRAVTLANLKPVFIDCNEACLMNDTLAWEYMEQGSDGGYRFEVSAIMQVHIYGRQSNERLSDLANACDIPTIEDLSECHGIRPRYNTEAACWSFYKNKIVHGEEGGAVAFKDPAMANHARQLRSLGMGKIQTFNHVPRGHNYRLSNAHAQLIRNNLKNYTENARDRREIEGWYDVQVPKEWHMPARHAVWVYDLRIPGLTYEQQSMIVDTLNQLGIEARRAFRPMRSQPEYYEEVGETMAKQLSREVLYLPVRPDLNKWDVLRNVTCLIEVAGNVGVSV